MTRSKSLLACFVLWMVLLPLATSSKDGVSQSQSDGDREKRAIQQWTVERRTGTQISYDLKTPPYVRRLTYFGAPPLFGQWGYSAFRRSRVFRAEPLGQPYEYRGTVGVGQRFMAFQLAKDGEPAGVGHGIFVYDFEAAKKSKGQ